MYPASSHGTGTSGVSGGGKPPLTPDAAATRIQAAFRGYKARNLPVHPMKFVTWRNTTNPKQAEHMTVKFGSGGASSARYVDFRQGTGDRHDIEPVKGVQNLLTASSAASSTPSLPPSKPFQNLAYGEHTPSEHRARFLARPALPSDKSSGRDFRYDSREYVRAKVTFQELRTLKATVDDRKEDGVFHLFGEASAQEPKTTRCMTMIETLANMRGMKLDNANTSIMARQFHTLNQQSPKFKGTTTAPKLRRHEVQGAPRASSEEVTRTAAVRKTDGSKLDLGYWKQHDAGAHNVGRPQGPKLS
jgi:hypothetical protein